MQALVDASLSHFLILFAGLVTFNVLRYYKPIRENSFYPRFGHRLSTDIITESDFLNCKIPPLILQPLVENAIKFGLYDVTGDVTISIICQCNQNNLTISITNPFDATTSSPQKGVGFGLSSVQRRLYLLYARNDLISTTHQNNLFTTTVIIPQLV
jgi:sensor histidine kinase YesM